MKKILLSALVTLFSTIAVADVFVLSDRPEAMTDAIAGAFEEAYGELVIVKTMGTTDIINGIENGTLTADAILVKDLIYLNDLSKNLAPLSQSTMNLVPAFAQGADNKYVGVTYRARSIIYNTFNVDPSELSTYEDLADPKWQGRLCLRTSQSTYNEALVSSLVANNGEEKAQEIVNGWVNNLAIEPLKGDTAVIDAVFNGQCDVGIINSYYLAVALANNPNLSVDMFFANQNTTGTHVNGFGAGVIEGANNKAAAEQFVAFLLTPEMQTFMSESTGQFPAASGVVSPIKTLQDWSGFTIDQTSWSALAPHKDAAVSIMTEANYK